MDLSADPTAMESPVPRALPLPQQRGNLALRVRLLGVFSFFAILGAGPVLQLVSGPARSHAVVSPPTWNLSVFRDGDWTSGLERYAQELSPLTYAMRGYYNESLLRLGLLDPMYVLLGSESWMFMASTLHVDQVRLEAKAEDRRRTLESLTRKCEELGVKLLAVPVPDKVRIYPERAFPDGVLPGDKKDLYARILREFEEAGIPSLNVEEVLQREKLAPTGDLLPPTNDLLYYQRDSHWTGYASRVVARAAQERLRELGWQEHLGEAVDLIPSWTPVEVVPDLVGILGLRAIAGPFDGSTPVEISQGKGFQRISSTVRSLVEVKDYLRLWITGTGGQPNIEYHSVQQRGKVALCGTSFSVDTFSWAFAFELGRLVDARGVVSAGGAFTGLQAQLGRIERGESEAEILVWEMVERSYLEAEWLEPPIFLP